MPDKLDELEAEREFFWEVCPKDNRESYEYCQLSKLTRVVLEHIPVEYDSAVAEVKNMVKLKKMLAGDKSAGVSTLNDIKEENFSEDWLPDYDELRVSLVNAYEAIKKRRVGERKRGTPAMMIGSGQQPGPGNITCYGCGQQGHKRGDRECTASPTDVWSGAPDYWKNQNKGRDDRSSGKGGKGKGKGSKGGGRGRGKGDGVCHSFTSGNEYCRYGDNCHFQHTGKPGGGKGKGGGRAKGKGKSNGSSSRKEVENMSALVVKSITKKANKRKSEGGGEEPSSKKSSGDENLFSVNEG